MRKAISRGVLALLAVLFLSSQASAAPIAVGWLQWLESIPGVEGQFSIVNQTGAGANYLLDPAFPVDGSLTFGSLNLAVVPNGPANLTAQFFDAASYDSDLYDLAARPDPTSATLTGIVNELQVSVDLDGLGGNPSSLWNIVGNALTDIGGNPVVLNIPGVYDPLNPPTAILYVDAAPAAQVVPEPASMFLLGFGVVGLIARRRKAARKA